LDSPYPHTPSKFGEKVQFTEYHGAPEANKDAAKHVQMVTGKFNLYARGVDCTLLTVSSALTVQQANPTIKTMKQEKQVLDNCASQEPVVITYHRKNMLLVSHSDSGYLNKSGTRSRTVGQKYPSKSVKGLYNNNDMLNDAKIIKATMSLAMEAELGRHYLSMSKRL
jgi:hypothetical protein